MKYIYIEDWGQFRKVLEQKQQKIVLYKIDKYKRKVELKIVSSEAVYVYRSKPDSFPYECGIIEEPTEDLSRLAKAEPVTNTIFGKDITYLVGAQKIRGFNLWCVYSDFERTIREELSKVLEDYILVEADLSEESH